MQILESAQKLGHVIPNIASMLKGNSQRFSGNIAFQERLNGDYAGTTWTDFYEQILNIAYNLKSFGFTAGDKVVIFSMNRLEMLLLELAVMSSGGIAVPIFFNYNQETAGALIKHSDAKFLAVGSQTQLSRIDDKLPLQNVIVFDNVKEKRFKSLVQFGELISKRSDNEFSLNFDASPDDICLNMYTSGTMGNQKCVQLTHRNILSQQAALKLLWNIDENDRLLSYLRWHHSFGGIFEKYTALSNGAVLSHESSQGLDPNTIMENWKLVKPTVFFSVPMIYQQLIDLTLESKEAEELFFHSGLKFVFTAAAPLPQHISDEFEKRKIPVIEGWGLTETAPCCTLTDPELKREPGVVGNPIPGVSVALEEDGEILVKGPNVMVGYYNNDTANEKVFNSEGWFCTGDIGEFTQTGLKLITRKDRIFKLSNAEKVIPTELESKITGKCHFISYALIEGSGKDYPVALLFPNKRLLDESNINSEFEFESCTCPKSMGELAACLKGCLANVNCGLKQRFARIKTALLIDDELSVDKSTLTPSMKMAPTNVKEIYKTHIEILYDTHSAQWQFHQDAYLIIIED